MRYFLFCLSLLAGLSLQAQYHTPEKGEIFRDDVIPRIDINLPADSLAAILDPNNKDSNYHYHARFIFDNGTIRDTMENIGFRLRGNTSRSSQKKSFKVSFNTFDPGRKYYGLEKMNLNGEHNDPTIARSKLCWELYRQAGIPASRANHIELYINGSYFGLYIHVEHIDELFVKRRFNNNNGNLYKCLWPADLAYKGSNPNLYKGASGGRRAYDLKTNTAADDYSDIAEFIDVLNNTPINSLPCELEKVFDVNSYIKVMAMDILTANWDGPIYNKNNFYLYYNTQTDRFVYIPYDLDNTYGIDWFRIDWATRNIYQWGHSSEARPIYERILQVPLYRERFSHFIHEYASTFVNPNTFFPYIDSIETQITPSAAIDVYRTRDYGFSMMDFHRAFDQALSQNHLPYGIKDYLTTRRNSILQQVQSADMTPIIYLHQQRFFAGIMRWELRVVDEKPLKNVKVVYKLDGSPDITVNFRDDGMLGDSISQDGIWTAETNWSVPANELSFYFTAEDSASHIGREPFCGENAINLAYDLVINEFMADNDSTLADNFGEFEDYIELYNRGSQPVYLGDLYITDDLAETDKDKLPEVTLAPKSYLLLWADSDSPQGDNHLNFKLSKNGEQIGIFTSPTAGAVPIDTLSFGPQTQDVSSGRLPNGTGPIVVLGFPSPGGNNEWMTAIDDESDLFKVYPNPFQDKVVFDMDTWGNRPALLQIFDLEGRIIASQPLNADSNSWKATGIASGMYVAKIAVKGLPDQFVKLVKN
jgi:hypothetical protein